ncbi:MAG: DUF2268 domain-containing protein [Candidatus Krumholzibacteria bacterium]|nr:DUF2268 domain-containing protein [Candidatus Krumholzibacteria bacterium]
MRSESIRVAVLAALTAAWIIAPDARAQQQLTDDVVTDPAAARFVYEDVEHFILAMEKIASGADTSETLQSEYLTKATAGLTMFIEKYDLTVERLTRALRAHPEKYQSLEASLNALREAEPAFRDVYSRLKLEIPDAVFPPTYFLVAGHRGIGSGSIEGPLISIEKKTVESIREDLPATLVHEMVHMEQLAVLKEDYFAIFSGEEKTLLALSVREGVATYFAERVTGGSKHKNAARDYLLAHEKELWDRFHWEMLGSETGEWLWSAPGNPEQPRDIGYAIGARIVEVYYESAKDKHKSVQEILEVTDYEAFLAKSGYGELFE